MNQQNNHSSQEMRTVRLYLISLSIRIVQIKISGQVYFTPGRVAFSKETDNPAWSFQTFVLHIIQRVLRADVRRNLLLLVYWGTRCIMRTGLHKALIDGSWAQLQREWILKLWGNILKRKGREKEREGGGKEKERQE